LLIAPILGVEHTGLRTSREAQHEGGQLTPDLFAGRSLSTYAMPKIILLPQQFFPSEFKLANFVFKIGEGLPTYVAETPDYVLGMRVRRYCDINIANFQTPMVRSNFNYRHESARIRFKNTESFKPKTLVRSPRT
jgi:hypothetical protein